MNQAEIYHSIIQRKVLDPNDFESPAEIARVLNEYERHYNQIAQPFDWNFTRQDVAQLLDRLDDQPAHGQRAPPALAA
jgi:DNA primase